VPARSSPRQGPPLRLRLAGRAISRLIANAPFLWPLMRGRTRRFWERMAPGWDERMSDRADRLAALAAACDRLPRPPERILEIGTGTGDGARVLARRFPEADVHAADLSPAMVRTAESKTPDELRVSYLEADAAELPFEGASFDVVAQVNVPVYFTEVARVLRPGGHVVVASTFGPRTPYYTAHSTLRRRFSRRGVEEAATGEAGGGDFWIGRREAAEQR
jgi:SAM-dependent methyltransferase